jgi:hypothetical protein
VSEFTPERTMTEGERDLADSVYAAIQRASNFSERSQQSQDFRIGISDLGWCSEKVRRMVAGIPEPPTDKLPAFAGTALGDHIERACLAAWPHALVQQDVAVTLHGDGGDYRVGGHPDMILPEGKLIDFKTSRGLGKARRSGPDQQQQFQRHCYALGAWEGGLFHESVKGPEEVQVANVWMDRSCDERELWVDMEPFSWDVIDQAAMWVDDLVYSYRNDMEARKEPAREICAKTCGHFPTCRALDTDVQGLLTDDGVLLAVDMYREGLALEKRARKLKDEAKETLNGVAGSTGKFSIRWVHVNESEVHYTRQPYDRLDVRSTT